MAYKRAIEGTTNAQVLDPAFHRGVTPPSVADRLNSTGPVAPPVESANRPLISSYPRPANPRAASDLRGQQGLNVALDRLTAHRAKIIARERGVAQKRENVILQAAIEAIQRNRERQLSGLGEQAPLTGDIGVSITMVTPLNPSVIATKVLTGQSLTAQEAAVWQALTPEARGIYVKLPVQIAQAQVQQAAANGGTVGLLDQFNAWLQSETFPGVKNLYLFAAGLGVAVVAKGKHR